MTMMMTRTAMTIDRSALSVDAAVDGRRATCFFCLYGF